ncbi:MAG: hypothetical protein U0R72_04605 [Nakamurella multipartita]
MSLDLTISSASPSVPPSAPSAPALRAVGLAAVGRDLDRLSRVLAEPVTAVRRAALVAHIGFLVDQIRVADPDLAERQAGPLSRLRHESRCWSREPGRREALLGTVRQAAAALGPAIAARSDVTPPAGRPDPTPPIALRDLPTQHPTALAYRYFWLLDELPPAAAATVVGRYRGSVRWVLRNVLSGGYNRRAYLMWFGGGTGPAL